MSANPPLTQSAFDGSLVPTPFDGEQVVLSRDTVRLIIDHVRTPTGKWTADGNLFLTNMRLVFVATAPDAASGLTAFALPLSYLSADTEFKQPLIKCNHLAGKCKPVVEGDGDGADLPLHEFKLEFRGGGVGTFLPLYFRFLEYIRAVQRKAETGSAAWTPPVEPMPAPAAPAAPRPSGPARPVDPIWPVAAPPVAAGTAIVDPSDPSKLYLTQPLTTETAGPPGWGGPPPPAPKK